MTGKSGGALYANFDGLMQNLLARRTITITSFGNDDGGWDRISLEREHKFSSNDTCQFTYSVTNNVIRRKVECKKRKLDFEFDEMIVNGKEDRVREVTEEEVNKAATGKSDVILMR